DNTQDSNSGGSDSKDKLYNMKEKLNEKMKEYSNKSDDVIRKPWTNATVEKAIHEILDSNNPETNKTSRQYGLTRKYDTMEIGEKRMLIEKRKSNDDPVVVIIPVEEYFDKLLQYHRATGHGGRDKMLEEDLERFKDSYKEREMVSEGGENQVASLEQEMCSICSRNLNEASFVSRQDKIVTERQKSHEDQKRVAEKMIETSGKKLKSVAVAVVVLSVPWPFRLSKFNWENT
ncbi:hypothetical protein ILUMI_17471, partial [Ignelater luminosus]